MAAPVAIAPPAAKSSSSVQEAVNLNPEAQDCYFYFYSSCSKGDSCKFRHCSAALGSEEICSLWQNATCQRKVCAFRHSQLDRQRSAIQCYWETQSTGCLKPHCPFYHTKPRPFNLDYRGRMDTFKNASIKVKNLEELQREKEVQRKKENMAAVSEQRKENMEEDKNVDGGGRGSNVEEDKKKAASDGHGRGVASVEKIGDDGRDKGVALDLRKELLKRILAEQKALRERRASETTVEGEGQVPPDTRDRVSRREQHGDRHHPLGGRHERSQTTPTLTHQHDRHISCREAHSPPRGGREPHGSGGRRRSVKGRGERDRRRRKSKDTARLNSKRSPPLHNISKSKATKTTPTPHDPMDFKVKTLDELRAEKKRQAAGQSDLDNTDKRVPTSEEGRKERRDALKKVTIVRRKISHEIRPPTTSVQSTRDGGAKRELRDREMEVPTQTKKLKLNRRDIVNGEGCGQTEERGHTEESSYTHHAGGDRTLCGAGEEGGGVGPHRKRSIAEIKTEILQDLVQAESQDDHLLLEEMALYQEEEGQEAGSDSEAMVGVGLSDSKSHDELMLQMEEFM